MPDLRPIKGLTSAKLDDIAVEDRQRPISEAVVAALMPQIAARGLEFPIMVRKRQHRGGDLVLIAGAHRLEAARRLGWTDIPVTAYRCNDLQARQMEIDENLVRKELEPLDLAAALSEQKEVYEKLNPGSKAGNAGALARWSDANDKLSFALVAADRLDVNVRSIQRLVAAGDAIRRVGVDAFRVSDVRPTKSDLDAFAKCTPKVQAAVAILLRAETAKTIPEAIEQAQETPKRKIKRSASVVDAVLRLPKADKREFAEHLLEFEDMRTLISDILAEMEDDDA